ncbi:MAG: mycothiol conjugate amidase Mca [Actinomycetota bacterium]
MTPLSLLTVHAHPDDESSKGAGTVRRYRDQGVRTTLVCCTHGEEGDILNPELDVEEVKANLTDVRLRELDDAAEIIGYDRVHLLGYRDSGMAESESNEHPDCFHQAPVEEAVGRLVEVIRQERPQVIVTYSDDQAGYPHPDHLKVHDITIPAFEAAGDPDAYPDHGEPWQPLKLYYSVWARARMVQTHEKFLELGLESPFDDKWFERPSQDHRITTQVPVDNDIRRRALLCHRTQVDPSSPFWFGLPPEVQREIHPFDDYVLARSLVDAPTPEDDLFAGVRQAVSS